MNDNPHPVPKSQTEWERRAEESRKRSHERRIEQARRYPLWQLVLGGVVLAACFWLLAILLVVAG